MKNKYTTMKRVCGAAALCTTFLFAFAPAVHAATFNYTVRLEVETLIPDLNGPYSLDLQLVQGSGNVSNTVTLSNFQVSSGSFLGSPDYTNGGESGSTASSVILTTSAGDNEFAEEFSAGTTQITFNVSETNNQETVTDGTPIPDQFNVAILDTNLNNILTTDPSGGNELVSHAMLGTQGSTQVQLFSSTGADGNGGVVASIPEPGSTAAIGMGAAMLLAFYIRRKASKANA